MAMVLMVAMVLVFHLSVFLLFLPGTAGLRRIFLRQRGGGGFDLHHVVPPYG
jgi:hypothetical protein